ncbi:MAG: trypsin-like peptidase domain-containing protein, partial [Deltaproteobacteria bacterium]|nr:trypsin-like peptidase domain-containing protein [Deltaproteobacteria bacterium]
IEAARQQQAAGISTVQPQAAGAAAAAAVAAATASAGAPPATDGSTGDPVTTVRMQRERILRALAEDIAINPPLGEVRDPLTASQANAPLARGGAQGVEARERRIGEGDGEGPLDPVQIAAAAIQKLRARASTDFAELRTHYHRHDLVVLLAALVVIIVAGRFHTGMVTPPNVVFPEHEQDQEAIARGLTFEHSQAWLKAERLPPWPPRIARDPTGQPPKANGAYHASLTSSVDPNARIEIFIDKRPAWTNIVTGLELDRRTRWGELYTLDSSTVEEIEDQNWLRTAYRYAHAPEKGDVPRVDRAVEYATVDREQIYVVTLFGSATELARIEKVVAPSLRVPQKPGSRSALPLVPQTRGASHRSYPDPVAKAFDSTVMIVVADMVDGRLVARGGGSGVIVGADGSMLTNYHVIHDKNGRLHDVFVVGRFSQLDMAPQLQCAGRPNRSKLQRELDLALIKCDTNLDGRTWTPGNVGIWATLAPAKATDVKIGQRLWVLGFPDVGGGGLTLSTGEIGGWTGQDGAAGRDFIKTDASITHGNSGGPAVDDQGRLVGIATASRTKLSQNGGVIETKQVGLVRPLATAADLLAIAAIGWTPREGHTDVEIQPSAVEATAEGIRIATHVLDHANESPVRDALVMVLKPGVLAGSIDINRLDDQVIAWGRSNTQGEVQMKQPVPFGTYTVLVRASGYQPLIGENALVLDDKSPAAFDPWGGIRLRPL